MYWCSFCYENTVLCFAAWKRLRKVVIGTSEVWVTRNCFLHVVWRDAPGVVWAKVLDEMCLTEVLVLCGPEGMVQNNREFFPCRIFFGPKTRGYRLYTPHGLNTGRNTQIRRSYYRRRKLFAQINGRTWCSCLSFTHELRVGELNSVPASFATTWCGVEGEGGTLLATSDVCSPVAERTRSYVERYQKRRSKVVLNFILVMFGRTIFLLICLEQQERGTICYLVTSIKAVDAEMFYDVTLCNKALNSLNMLLPWLLSTVHYTLSQSVHFCGTVCGKDWS
jgi:hypothetical protein